MFMRIVMMVTESFFLLLSLLFVIVGIELLIVMSMAMICIHHSYLRTVSFSLLFFLFSFISLLYFFHFSLVLLFIINFLQAFQSCKS